ncbi:hypothetical protein VKT23_009917, partial [Stygiomarasmius scandens]
AHITHVLKEIGFEDIWIEPTEAPIGKRKGKAGVVGADWQYRGFSSMESVIMQYSGFGIVNNSDEYQSMLAELQREWDEGIPWMDYVVVSARKPW